MPAAIKYDLGLSRFVASALVFNAHCQASVLGHMGRSPVESSMHQISQLYLGFPSLVLLCMLTGIAANLTQVPDRSDRVKLSAYLTGTVGLWIRLVFIYNIVVVPACFAVLAALSGSKVRPEAITPWGVFSGFVPFWYLTAMVCWTVLRLWCRTRRQMMWLGAGLACTMIMYWFVPGLPGVSFNRIVIGIWFIWLGAMVGPRFCGNLVRAPMLKLLCGIAVLASLVVLNELLLHYLFGEKRIISFYRQPSLSDFGSIPKDSMIDLFVARFLAAFQIALMWTIIFGFGLVQLYLTSRLGSLLSAKSNSFLAESSFGVYTLHCPLFTDIFAMLLPTNSSTKLVFVSALLFSMCGSVLLSGFTVLIRKSVGLRFLLWYRV